MYKIRELLEILGEAIPSPEICTVHGSAKVNEAGFCAICDDDTWSHSMEEVRQRIEMLFLIHQPTEIYGIKACSECGQAFPCLTLTTLDGLPVNPPGE